MADRNKTLNFSKQMEKTIDSQNRSLFLDESAINYFNFRDSYKETDEIPIQVFVKVNPVITPEPSITHTISGEKSDIRIINNHQIQIINETQILKSYDFEAVFAKETNDQVFLTTAIPLIKNTLKGNNSSLFTYGYSGTGTCSIDEIIF
jgi:hypothetical protein